MISVITCAHNPRPGFLARTLEGLMRQTLSRDHWEYVLVDNRSEPALDGRIDLSWHERGRIVREDQLGLTPARLRGIREARGELLVFVDDDNVLDPDYLEHAQSIAWDFPFLGAWSGSCRGEFEIPPPEWSRRYLRSLCVGDVERDLWSNFPYPSEALPSGAGLCIRSLPAREHLRVHEAGGRPFVLDRTGASLVSGGDVDLDLTCTDLGLGLGVFTRLKLTHLIPAFRLEEDYLVRLAQSMAFSSVIMDYYRPRPGGQQRPGFKTRVANRVRMLLLPRLERRFFRATQKGLEAGRQAVERIRAGAGRAQSPVVRG